MSINSKISTVYEFWKSRTYELQKSYAWVSKKSYIWGKSRSYKKKKKYVQNEKKLVRTTFFFSMALMGGFCNFYIDLHQVFSWKQVWSQSCHSEIFYPLRKALILDLVWADIQTKSHWDDLKQIIALTLNSSVPYFELPYQGYIVKEHVLRDKDSTGRSAPNLVVGIEVSSLGLIYGLLQTL